MIFAHLQAVKTLQSFKISDMCNLKQGCSLVKDQGVVSESSFFTCYLIILSVSILYSVDSRMINKYQVVGGMRTEETDVLGENLLQ
jgi:hypothetical protein